MLKLAVGDVLSSFWAAARATSRGDEDGLTQAEHAAFFARAYLVLIADFDPAMAVDAPCARSRWHRFYCS